MNNKQNILIVHNYYQIPGGEDTVVANEMKMLEENGHKVTLYTRSNNELKTMSKFKELFLPFTTIFNIRTYRDIKRIIKEKNIDIVHVHNTLNLISPSVYYAALNSKIPVVQTVHNFRLLCPAATFYRDGHICEDCLTKGLGCAIKHNCYRNSKLQTLACVINTRIHRLTGIYGKINYICLTEFNKDKLLSLKQIKSERVFVKPNFVKEETYKNNKREFYVYVGRLEDIKGVKDLLEVWHKLGNDFPLLKMCGDGPLKDYCVNYINNNNITNIELLGYVKHEEVKDIISRSKYLILPTRVYEGFPMTVIEAFSQGTPVIVPDMGNAGSLVIKDLNGYKFQNASLDELVEVMNNAEDKPQDNAKIHKLYKEKYSDEVNYKMLKEIYNNLKNNVG